MDDSNFAAVPSAAAMQPKRKKGSGCLIRILGVIACMFVLWWANNYLLFVTDETISSKKVKNEIKIAVLSDLHASTSIFAISNESIIKKLRKMQPDVVCVLGDMHSSDASDEEKEISLNLMRGIVSDGYRLFFVLGEHDDRTNGYVAKMEKYGINVLDGESEKVKIKDTELTFYGISNAWFSENFDLRNEFRLDKDNYNVLLAHIPMYDYYNEFGADLTLCADTHGGIIRVPFLGPFYCEGKFMPKLTSDEPVYDKGLFKTDKGYMFITSGIGNYPIAARFNNFPEIVQLTVRPGGA